MELVWKLNPEMRLPGICLLLESESPSLLSCIVAVAIGGGGGGVFFPFFSVEICAMAVFSIWKGFVTGFKTPACPLDLTGNAQETQYCKYSIL